MPPKGKPGKSRGGRKAAAPKVARKSSGKRPALGRGLGALIPTGDEAAPAAAGGGVTELPLDRIQPRPDQPRKVFDEQKLTELAESISELGVFQPLLVRKVGRAYEIVVGERRWRAAKLAGLDRVPVQIATHDDLTSFQIALVENLQREDLNPLEEAEAFQRLVQDFDQTQEEVAKRVGKDRSTVANALRLLQLPPAIKTALVAGQLSPGHCRALLSLPPSQVELVARQVISKGLSVRATEALARKVKQPAPSKPGRPQSAEVRDLETQLTHGLGTRVQLKTKSKQAGRIEISYHSLAELDRLLDKLLG